MLFNFALKAQMRDEAKGISTDSTLAVIRDEQFLMTAAKHMDGAHCLDEVADDEIRAALSVYMALQWDTVAQEIFAVFRQSKSEVA